MRKLNSWGPRRELGATAKKDIFTGSEPELFFYSKFWLRFRSYFEVEFWLRFRNLAFKQETYL